MNKLKQSKFSHIIITSHNLQECVNLTYKLDPDANQITCCEIIQLEQQLRKTQNAVVIVIGGDGSICQSATIAAKSNTPLIGVNRGKLGFLTDFLPNDVEDIINAIVKPEIIQSRQMLQANITGQDTSQMDNIALNDWVIRPGKELNMLEISITIDDKELCSPSADGVIIATPTGSTAYSLSAGGPIIDPRLECILVVPICAHTLNSRPIIIPPDKSLKLQLVSHNNANLYKDGNLHCDITDHSIIEISLAKEKVDLIHPVSYNFYKTLKKKLHWEQRPNAKIS